jgi:hypothetical protein
VAVEQSADRRLIALTESRDQRAIRLSRRPLFIDRGGSAKNQGARRQDSDCSHANHEAAHDLALT